MINTYRNNITYYWHLRDDTEDPPENEVKFLVFRSHLSSLFTVCRSCHQLCSGEVAQQMGTFISIKQSCSHCDHEWLWNSQPFIKNKPAGNILISAAILFSGSTPAKVLNFLNCLNVALRIEHFISTRRNISSHL